MKLRKIKNPLAGTMSRDEWNVNLAQLPAWEVRGDYGIYGRIESGYDPGFMPNGQFLALKAGSGEEFLALCESRDEAVQAVLRYWAPYKIPGLPKPA
jgi:hypothetical protein